MHLDTITNLIDWHETQCHWSSDPILHDKVNGADNLIHLCQAIGPSSQVPITSYDQPPIPPKDSSYQFDTNLFTGLSAQNDIVQLLKSSCPDCKMFLQKEGQMISSISNSVAIIILLSILALMTTLMTINSPSTTLYAKD